MAICNVLQQVQIKYQLISTAETLADCSNSESQLQTISYWLTSAWFTFENMAANIWTVNHSAFLRLRRTNATILPTLNRLKITVARHTKFKCFLPCSYGENVPASMFIYGSILIEVTCSPQPFRRAPILLEITPFPIPLITPPVTKMYFIIDSNLFAFTSDFVGGWWMNLL